MADTSHSKCDAARRAGSSPASGITKRTQHMLCSFLLKNIKIPAVCQNDRQQAIEEKYEKVLLSKGSLPWTWLVIGHWSMCKG